MKQTGEEQEEDYLLAYLKVLDKVVENLEIKNHHATEQLMKQKDGMMVSLTSWIRAIRSSVVEVTIAVVPLQVYFTSLGAMVPAVVAVFVCVLQ